MDRKKTARNVRDLQVVFIAEVKDAYCGIGEAGFELKGEHSLSNTINRMFILHLVCVT